MNDSFGYTDSYESNENYGYYFDDEEPKALPPINDALVWYVAILPLIGLFAQTVYATSFGLGVLLWGLVLILGRCVCYYDYTILDKHGKAVNGMKPLAIAFPVIYLIQRSQVLNQRKIYSTVMLLTACLGFFGNGFVRGLSMNDESYMITVRDSSVVSLIDLEDYDGYTLSTDKIIGTSIDELCTGKQCTWSYKEIDGNNYVYANNIIYYDRTNKVICVCFKVLYDKFAYSGIELESITIGDKELVGDKYDEFVKRLFYEVDTDEEDEDDN